MRGSEVLRKAEAGRRSVFLLGVLAVLGLSAASAAVSQFDPLEGLAAFPKALDWMGKNFLPDTQAWSNFPKILRRLGDTVLVALMATTAAGGVSLILAILGSRITRFHPWVTWLVRATASLCRNVPMVAWTMIFLLAFGQTYLTGFLALFLETLGFLTRSFLETIDEAASAPVEALRAVGASWAPTVAHAVIPSILPSLTSWLLFMFETNIRSATLVGLLTGTGVGFLFDFYYKTVSFPSAGLVTLTIVVLVLLVEGLSFGLRKAIL